MKRFTSYFAFLLGVTIFQSGYAMYWNIQGNEAKYFHEDLLAIIMQCACFVVYAIDNAYIIVNAERDVVIINKED